MQVTTKAQAPALGADGWFTTEGEPHLLGGRCTTCGTHVFPNVVSTCPNPACAGTELEVVPLSRRGKVWSYTDAQYAPPAPYVAPDGEHVPFCIAAVELPEGLVVMGQVTSGVTVADLSVGMEVELVVDVLFSDDDTDHLVWKWQPVAAQEGA